MLTTDIDSRIPEDHELRYSGTSREATDIDNDIHNLAQKLAGFDAAWESVTLSCEQLEDWLTLAHRTRTVRVTSFLGMHHLRCSIAMP